MRHWLICTKRKQLEFYKGMLIHADAGVHEQAAALFQKYVPVGADVVDVGAGAGAFSQRLVDMGYKVTALDIDPDEWTLENVPFYEVDVNRSIAETVRGPFDVAVCLEVIEHIENPWNLLRELYAILKPGGRLILSTPNVTSFLSRLVFLRTGKLHGFDEAALSYGHINPITAFEMTTIASQTGWRLLETRPGGYLPVFDFTALHSAHPLKIAKIMIFNVLRGLVYGLGRGQKRGWVLFFVLEKPQT